MATFNVYNSLPLQTFNPSKNYSNNPYLGLLGYDQTGKKNLWGEINSYIPGVNVGVNALAQDATKGTDSNQAVQGDMGERVNKLLTEAALAATVFSGGAAAPALGAVGAGAGVGSAIGSGAAAGAVSAAGLGTAGTIGGAASAASPYLKQGLDLLKPQKSAQSAPENDNSYSLNNYTNY